jgi:hypothetical protein
MASLYPPLDSTPKQLSVFAGKIALFFISTILKIDAVVQLFTANFGLPSALCKPLKLCGRVIM